MTSDALHPPATSSHEVADVRAKLTELGLDLHRIWRHTPDELWGRLDPELWSATHNRWVILQTVSDRRLAELADDPTFRDQLDQLWREHEAAQTRRRWFHDQQADPDLRVAYFSMEFMLSEALPIYSGGLGNVAGDQLKAADDLGVPVVAIGLLYQQGYFRQVIDADGEQRAVYPYNDPSHLPISPVRDADGEWVRVTVPFAGSPVRARAWQVRVGRVTLYLLDANVPSNRPEVRGVTSELYGGGTETRLAQEILLGIGGVRLLDALGLDPAVYHLNEGHASFAVLERARLFAERHGCSFQEARSITRAGNLFTTHTPVAAGFDRFPTSMVGRYLGRYLSDEVGVDADEVLALGADAERGGDVFNMAHLAVRSSGAVNGVSELHGRVSRRLFAPLFPRWPLAEIPIGSVTNGIHVDTWIDSAAASLWRGVVPPERFTDGRDTEAYELDRVADAELWSMRSSARSGLVRFVRDRWNQHLTDGGADPTEAAAATQNLFDPNALTIGFARRFAEYKRPTLLLRDPDRLARILGDRERPVQLLVAGKAHPADERGRAMISEWVRFSKRPDVAGSVIFLADYDMLLTRQLVQGVDLWVNNPLRPWEASGTSGMKILPNGGLNLSVADGWWAEAFRPGRGWAIGGDDGGAGEADAESMYRLLEEEIVPRFYERDEHGLPAAWVTMIRESMRTMTARFSADRTVRQYTERYYLPLAASYRSRVADDLTDGLAVAAWTDQAGERFGRVHTTQPVVDETGSVHLFGYLADLDPSELAVELYAEGVDAEAEPTIVELAAVEPLVGAENAFRFEATLGPERPPEDFSLRLRLRRRGVIAALEAPSIAWLGRLQPIVPELAGATA